MQTGYSVIKILLGNVPLTADTVITNLDGAKVWLKDAFDPKGRRIAVSACCPESDPCPWHAAIARLIQSAGAMPRICPRAIESPEQRSRG